MRYALALLWLTAAWGQSAAPTPAGKWISILTFFDENDYDHLELSLSGTTLTGKLGSHDFAGTFQNGRIEGTVKLNPKETGKLEGRLEGDRIVGTGTIPEEKVD